ncbi:TfuA-like protein [Ancylobacter sp.]|uniref:TfuA-like protein n=1 Tax=Ancylobacter sp. TaxID=1872567 RepID=UPI003BAC5271
MRAVLDGRRTIGLVDGTFESGPAVWHKEILFALAAGCRVLGAASMGALRAAECWQDGMIGVGTIFEDYRSGRRSADADVALVYGPAELGYIPCSVPLVDVDDVAARARLAGVIDMAEAAALNAASRRLHFKLRSWDAVLEGFDARVRSRIMAWLAGDGPGAKSRDAQALIDQLILPGTGPGRVPSAFLHTQFSSRLLSSLRA